MDKANDPIERGIRAWGQGDIDGLAAVLDPAVTLRAATPGPWDCENRDQVIRLLREREVTRDPAASRAVEVRQIDDDTFVVSSPSGTTTATRISVARGKVVAMQQFETESRP